MNKMLIHNNTSYTYEGAKKIEKNAHEALQNSYKRHGEFLKQDHTSEFGSFLEDLSNISFWFVLVCNVTAFFLRKPINIIPFILFGLITLWYLIYQYFELKKYIKKLDFFIKESNDLYQAWVLAYNNYCVRYYQNLLHEVVMETKNRTLTEKEFKKLEEITRVK